MVRRKRCDTFIWLCSVGHFRPWIIQLVAVWLSNYLLFNNCRWDNGPRIGSSFGRVGREFLWLRWMWGLEFDLLKLKSICEEHSKKVFDKSFKKFFKRPAILKHLSHLPKKQFESRIVFFSPIQLLNETYKSWLHSTKKYINTIKWIYLKKSE